MQYLKRFALIVIIFSSLTAWAAPVISAGFMPGGFSIEGEWIYFSPISESSYYAVSTTTSGVDQADEKVASRLDNFHSGYRISAAYTSCDCGNSFIATWSHLHASNSSQVTGASSPLLVSVGAFSGDFFGTNFASDRKTFDYSALELILNQRLLCNSCIYFCCFEGIQCVDLRSKDDFFYNITPALVTSGSIQGEIRDQFRGIGPEVGIGASRNVWNNFSLNGIVTGALLIGQPKARVAAVAFENGAEIKNLVTNVERAWRLVPYIDIRLGLNYQFACNYFRCFDNFGGSLEIGYEGLCYFNGLNDAPNDINFYSYRNVTMHGPYAALLISF